VVEAVGGHGLTYGGSYYFNTTILGYPENIENGEIMQLCSGTTEPRTEEIYTFISLDTCNFGKGSSGGPWLSQYNNATGYGIFRGVSSWLKWTKHPDGTTTFDHINSPYFTSDVLMLYYAANSADW